ncbi:glycosyl transferase [Octadecabacter sp. CECT 8868]|uniref:glycosyl transferase n=1 Tax=Octadecabacter algicola TaxID=2909342 RepID=UPI001F1F7F8B|nr:glycosyl transferase [Octadecabacter algicola]MCF2905268.1 glycosyl transferase [Octadecabacter algicola]
MQSASRLTCICIKWGTLYPTEHVNRLYRAVLRNTNREVDFYCMTELADGLDDGITALPLEEQPYEARMTATQKTVKKQGALRKIAMFNPALFSKDVGPVLALDLDILITGDLDKLSDFAPGQVTMRGPFAPESEPRTYGEGSFIKFEPKHHDFLYTTMAEAPEESVVMCKGSEQTYTSTLAHQNGMFTPYPSEWIVSFKYHCRPKRPMNLFVPPKLPENAHIVCFHGRPNVDEAMNGFKSDPFHTTRPAKWIADNWR